MDIFIKLSIIIISYLIGSIPNGLLIGFFKGVDLRKEGSGNIGATNAGRVLGKIYAIITYALDFIKAFIIVFLFNYNIIPIKYCILNPLLYGFIATIGHNYSIYLKFKGGKGVSAACGALSGYNILFLPLMMIIFFIIKKVSKLVSLSSLLTSLIVFIASIIVSISLKEFLILDASKGLIGTFYRFNYIFIIILFLIVLIIFIRHKDNIKRIIKNEEKPINY